MSTLQTNLMRRVAIGDFIRRSAARYPDKPALIYGEKTLTYKEFNQQINRFAHAMTQLGVQQGDKVAIISHNCPQFLVCFLGLAKIGAIITPLNFALKEQEISYIVNHSEAKVFIVEDILDSEVGKANLPEIKTYIGIRLNESPLPEGWLDFDSLTTAAYPDAEPEVIINGEDMAALLYTSGTEAAPKGVMGSHLNYFSVVLSIAADIGIRADDIFLVSTPLFHVAALTYQALSTLAMGGTIVLTYLPVLAQIPGTIEKHKITFISYPSTIFMAMAQMEGAATKDMSSVRVCFTYGQPTPSTTLRRCMEFMPKATWVNFYGQTELSPLGASNPDPLNNPQSIGLPHLPLEMKIVDEDDQELPREQVGELVARGPAVMMGYYKNPEKTAQTFKNGWLHTGDLARMDAEGNIYFVDRKKDIIKSGGENISSLEVEEALFKHPKVAEAAVIGVPHPYWMEAVAAVIVPKQNEVITEEEIISHCKIMLAGYKVPKQFIFVEQIPKNPSGKFLKRELRKMLEEKEGK